MSAAKEELAGELVKILPRDAKKKERKISISVGASKPKRHVKGT